MARNSRLGFNRFLRNDIINLCVSRKLLGSGNIHSLHTFNIILIRLQEISLNISNSQCIGSVCERCVMIIRKIPMERKLINHSNSRSRMVFRLVG